MRERLQRYPRQFWLMTAGVFVSNFCGSLDPGRAPATTGSEARTPTSD